MEDEWLIKHGQSDAFIRSPSVEEETDSLSDEEAAKTPLTQSRRASAITAPQMAKFEKTFTAQRKLIAQEKIELGRVSTVDRTNLQVKSAVYLEYMRAATLPLALSFIVLLVTYNLIQIGRNIWLSKWSDDNQRVMEGGEEASPIAVYLSVYGLLGLAECLPFHFYHAP